MAVSGWVKDCEAAAKRGVGVPIFLDTKRSDWRGFYSVRVRGADSALPVLGEANRPGATPRVRDR